MQPRLMRMRALLVLLILCGSWCGEARGHGGLPLSTRVLMQGGRLHVPAQYWGIFVGGDGGPWHWICDEAINPFPLRDVQIGPDGTMYATDFPGLTISRDGGCTWKSVTGGVAGLVINGLLPDPAGQRVWLAGTGDGIPGALYLSEDAGATWSAIHPADPARDPAQYLMRGLVLSADGRLHVLVDEGAAQDQPVVFTSRDGGNSFAATAVRPIPAGVVAGRARLVYADPRDGGVVYVHIQGDTDQVLLRLDTGTGVATEILRMQGYIFDVKVDLSRDRLLVATIAGLYAADGGAALKQQGALSQAQCLTLSADGLYACSSDYAPDRAAVAYSRDGGASFAGQFQFADTAGVMDCPAGSQVAQTCPGVWASYAAQLGIDVAARPAAKQDGGPVPADPAGGCGMAAGGRGDADRETMATVLAAALVVSLGLGKRRKRDYVECCSSRSSR